LDRHAQEIPAKDVVSQAAKLLHEGRILALKGLGGYHLACDASDNRTVARLRKNKHREDKPFALMAPNLEAIRKLCLVEPPEEALLCSRRSPIVLLRKREAAFIADEVAPGQRYLGLMLPYTPLHHLLLADTGMTLVMTSGNLSEEPIACADSEAFTRLSAIADFFLIHNREIHMRCDDSVARLVNNHEQLVRRSRGCAPEPVTTRVHFAKPVLGCGAQLKNTFCLAKGTHAFLSHHIGDLETYEAYKSYVEGIEHFQHLFDIEPSVVAHDLHPDYLSTKYAMQLAGATKVGVQHHHAHIASCMAEHNLDGPVIGVAFDGLGYGQDGTIWGGEFLVADLASYRRRAHLRYVPLAGGDTAIRQPWRSALSYLQDALGTDPGSLGLPRWEGVPRKSIALVRSMIEGNCNTVQTSSCGRLFDAVASILGLRHEVNYEGQAAIELEMAVLEDVNEIYPFEINGTLVWEIDMRPAIRSIVRETLARDHEGWVAAKFHNTLAAAIVKISRRLCVEENLNRVCLSGGTFQNMYLLRRVVAGLRKRDLEVFWHSRVPSNDGGLSLGQAMIANELVRRGGSGVLRNSG
jgi:hydrogenase maturation protein HypF